MTQKRDFVPVGHRLLVRLKKVEESTEVVNDWGFVEKIKTKDLVEREQYGTQEAYVVDIGFNCWKAFDSNYEGKPWVKVGDCVRVVKYSGDHLDLGDEHVYRVINDEDICGYYRGENLND